MTAADVHVTHEVAHEGLGLAEVHASRFEADTRTCKTYRALRADRTGGPADLLWASTEGSGLGTESRLRWDSRQLTE